MTESSKPATAPPVRVGNPCPFSWPLVLAAAIPKGPGHLGQTPGRCTLRSALAAVAAGRLRGGAGRDSLSHLLCDRTAKDMGVQIMVVIVWDEFGRPVADHAARRPPGWLWLLAVFALFRPV